MHFYGEKPTVVFQEVPDHLSVAFTIAGCPLRCKGCHSKHLWSVKESDCTELTEELFRGFLERYRGSASCILFMGGDQFPEELIKLLDMALAEGYSTALYTGYPDVLGSIKQRLTYLKTGHYVERLGGLDSPKTNQKFIEVSTGELLNYKFVK